MKKSEGGVCGGIPRGHKQVKVAYVKKIASQKETNKRSDLLVGNTPCMS